MSKMNDYLIDLMNETGLTLEEVIHHQTQSIKRDTKINNNEKSEHKCIEVHELSMVSLK